MKTAKLVLRSLLFYWRTNLGVLLGAAISTAIIVGALVVGDSIRYSLKQITLERLGRIKYALFPEDRFFRSALADEIAEEFLVEAAAVLNLKGIIIRGGGEKRINQVQILGVNNNFWKLAEASNLLPELGEEEAIINEQLAKTLDLQVGDEFLLRIEKEIYLPRETPLVAEKNLTLAQRLKIKAIATKKQLGNFNLRANQVAPYNVFLSRDKLAQEMKIAFRSNMLLVADNPKKKIAIEVLQHTLKKIITLADAGLEIKLVPGQKEIELISERIFIEPPIADVVLNVNDKAKGVFTYFVKQFRIGNKITPYSFVAAPGKPIVPVLMKDNGVIVNQWLANDLSAQKGDSLEMTYFVVGDGKTLHEKSTSFLIENIIPLSGAAADKSLMPAFTGLAEAENCRNWDPGLPINLNFIRDKDEKYWKNYRGTPKAFVTLAAAQKLWSNRFGNLTALRYPAEGTSIEKLNADVNKQLDPAELGMIFQPIKQQGLLASEQSTDFGQLFLGLSFFIVMAALLLTSLLFVFGAEFRSAETGLYLAIGFSHRQVKKIIFSEAILIALLGSIVGTILGVLYNKVVLYGLSTLWRGAVGTSSLQLKIEFPTLLTGALAGIFVAIFVLWLVIRKIHAAPISELQKSMGHLSTSKKGRWRWSLAIFAVCFIGVLVILLLTDPGKGKDAASAFFGAGSLLLIGGLALSNVFLIRKNQSVSFKKISIAELGFRNNTRKKGRSLTTIGMLACGIFIVVAVGANRHSTIQQAELRNSGTGGFALFAETCLPFVGNLNDDKVQKKIGLDKNISHVIQMRLRQGEDASCLNLNRVQQPKILGVQPEEFSRRGAFSFVKISDEVDQKNPWQILDKKFANNTIPAIADQTVITWGLGKSVGDTLTFFDERGNLLRLKLVAGLTNSIFQGHIIISEQSFLQAFPSNSGYNVFLFDAPFEKIKSISENLSWVLADYGIQISSTAERLAAFNAVENTYLSIFLALGGLGLMLGSFGLGIVVMRNILERRHELAFLRAVGFSAKAIRLLLVSEFWLLLLIGSVIGILTASISVLPAMLTPGTEIPYLTIFIILAAIIICGGFWPLLASKLAVRRDILGDLRNE